MGWESTLGLPLDLLVLGQTIVVLDGATDSVFHMFDAEDPFTHLSFAGRGEGPGEFKSAWTLDAVPQSPQDFWAYDIGLSRLTLYSVRKSSEAQWTSSYERIINVRTSGLATGPVRIDQNTFLSAGFFSSGRLSVLNDDGSQRGHFGPLPAGSNKVQPQVRQHAYQATLMAHPDRSLVALANRHASQIEIYAADGSSNIVVEGPLKVSPTFKVGWWRGRQILQTGSDLRFGYIDAAGSTNHVFALFSGRTRRGFPGTANFARFLHVFDWSGNFITAFALDACVLAIAVDGPGNTLYAIRHDPAPAILRFNLPQAIGPTRYAAGSIPNDGNTISPAHR